MLLPAVLRRSYLLCFLQTSIHFFTGLFEVPPQYWTGFHPFGPHLPDSCYGLESSGRMGDDGASTFCIGVEFKATGGLLFSNIYCSFSFSALINIQPTPPLAPLVDVLSAPL